ncbi:MAG: FAD-dependent oxidoreductase, partial [Clostridia bacterium]|nr:FAD-dependent oxidoreductase [Clostridia bacterium]
QDIEMTKILLTKLVKENGITVYLNTSVADAITEDGRIRKLIVATQSGLKSIAGKAFIDATGDGVLSYLAGEEIEIGREDGLVQPATVMFTVQGVDPAQTLTCFHEEDDTKLKKGSYLALCKEACKTGEIPPNVNIVRLYHSGSPDERMVNATQANGVNALCETDYADAQAELRMQMLTIVNFLKNNVEGFEHIRIKDSSDIVGIRESRRVVGLYKLCAEDLIEGRTFPDVVVHRSAFAIDIHNPAGAGQSESDGCPVVTKEYDIPYRSLVPLKNGNLLLAGRCISGTHRAHASYRVMNTAMNIGEAAGVAAALCAKDGIRAGELDVKYIQDVLGGRGIDLFS